ncbi:SPW repeat domain-containing protein [Adhaeribacter rhizoryzae]|uniref:SPW repeat-containing integral membrane domain-containing protein n=1 Tax=Adhaeribacter rhizoryzae TaxID=2607907 RepID=A0A5M6DC89_9BACT|nr:hypothetical protein [Adhaeribacter rhizoryzae]KAA5543932.1 hypothetical protein F0145_15220 [Adhaeribacter rhizoryzae]
MEKPINRFVHGIIDYKYAALVSAAPELAGFKDEEKTATTLCRVMGSGALMYSVFTRYELGLFRVMPFKTHLMIDFAANALAVTAPWLFGFYRNERARNVFLGAGLLGLAVGSLTQTQEMDETNPQMLSD